ncbi:hypothetical protein [Streptomyces europaeiscabiei]|uniref:hypothetical protein n=1 Tax=Streptomyces europaeiscabiei TaxID=146819 RepID=UPI000765ED7E|nr:hypothetical protein [Streptomyces europaeiscabiei]
MPQDPIRTLFLRDAEQKRARNDPAFVQALLQGKAPSVTAYCTALDMGHEGDAALTAARTLDQAAANFFTQQPTDNPPPAA